MNGLHFIMQVHKMTNIFFIQTNIQQKTKA